MNKYIKTMKIKGALRTPTIIEVPTEVHMPVGKGLKRKQINDEVFDIDDSVADNSKMISLLLGMMNNLYTAIPEDIKSNIEDRETVEAILASFKTETSFSSKLSSEGTELATKLFKRQEEISKIVNPEV